VRLGNYVRGHKILKTLPLVHALEIISEEYGEA